MGASRTQETIGGGCTQGQQVCSARWGQLDLLMPLQRFNELRQKRYQALGADAVGCIPGRLQGLLYVWSILPWSSSARRGVVVSGMGQQPFSIARMISCGQDKSREHLLFLRLCCLSIQHHKTLHQRASDLNRRSCSHLALLKTSFLSYRGIHSPRVASCFKRFLRVSP